MLVLDRFLILLVPRSDAIRRLVKDDNGPERHLIESLVDARKWKWRPSAGQLGRNVTGAENGEFGDPYSLAPRDE